MNIKSILFIVFYFAVTAIFAQESIKIRGKIIEAETNTPLPGVNIVIGSIGTISDVDGLFELSTSVALPAVATIKYIGYTTQNIAIVEPDTDFGVISLKEQAFKMDEIVVSASRVEENVLQSPVSIESMGIRAIQNTPSASFYDGVANLKGVQPNTGSLLFTSFNTRGFADPNNLRFVQLLDGASLVTPAFGVLGNTAGVSELDVASIEIVPGASSALYGADAFNGLLFVRTKDPFSDQGLSLAVKTGTTIQKRGANPYTQIDFRVAEDIVDEKLAFKIDFETIQATDWQKVDKRPRITNIATAAADEDYLNNNPVNNPAWDQVDRYGEDDSRFSNVELTKSDGTTETVPSIRRTGVAEKDIFNPDIEHYKINAGLFYRPIKGKKLELSYLYKYSISDLVFRITTSYPFYDFEQSQHQVQVKNSWLTVRGYYNKNTANNAFAGRFAGKTIEQTLLPNTTWLALYREAYAGNIAEIAADNHYTARLYADSFMALPGSSEYERAKDLALNSYATAGSQNRFSPQSGAKLFENSSYYHADLNLDLSQFLNDIFGFQLGGSYRFYELDSKGSFFNDGPLGFNGPIRYAQYGIYGQLSKKFFNSLKLSVSGRYDKRDELESFFTPRASLVYSFGEKKNHNIRLSYQTGFRNPTAQEGYINYWVAPVAFVLGGLKENIEAFQFEAADGSLVTAKTFFDNVPNVSYEDALKGLSPEKNTVYEVGYKTVFNNIFLDVSYTYTQFENFIQTQQLVSSNESGLIGVGIWYNNVKQTVFTSTVNAELQYKSNSGYNIGVNYSLNQLDASNYVKESTTNRAINLRFNTPEHRLVLSFGNDNIYRRLGFSVQHRINSQYDYKSSFGEHVIPSFGITDLAITKRLPKNNILLKVGGTNIFNEPYTFVYGGPDIGAMYYVSIVFNDLGTLFDKKNKGYTSF